MCSVITKFSLSLIDVVLTKMAAVLVFYVPAVLSFLVVLILSMWFASRGNCIDLERRGNMRKLATLNLTLLPLK